ncbi:uncharacterized protein B0P05DRAFT_124031 [Gilbertella persicaria]|uniref:uncharacterized protein n=1 Tax=Gilbertella persicaria TaxID=101096 RepID=UPI0022207FDB|nr:uncharacterized protein B0P05DRAFT_124031 [Gilbertella persicaria]KAI8077234.1 hypothetical protein B0P05DRAFT_124031 [Gilbertella persicaria]
MKYPLFDRTREKKSIRLVRKLQQEADSEWEKELATRKKQEAMDEAMAKELQAKEEQEERKRQNQSNAFNPFLSQGSFDSIEAKDHLNASTQYPTKQYKPHLITNLLCRSPSPILDKHTEPMMPLNTVVQPSNETLSTKTDMPIQTNVQPNANQSPTKPPLPIRKASIIKDSLATKKSDQKRQSSSVPSPTKYSDSFLLLKPDEKEHTAFVAIPVTERTDQMKTTNTKPTLQILDPTADLIKCQSKGKEKVEPYRVYEEKESQEDEHRLGHTSPYQPHILYPYSFSTPILANSSFAQDNQHPVNRVYPTNFLKAGAPPLLIHGPSSSRVHYQNIQNKTSLPITKHQKTQNGTLQ